VCGENSLGILNLDVIDGGAAGGNGAACSSLALLKAQGDESVGDQPFVVMCAAGVRSWIGYRIVRHAGFNVTMLSGGIQTLRAWLGEKAEAVLVTGEGRS